MLDCVIMLKTIHDELETFWVGSLHNHSFDNHCENECFRHAFARMFVCLHVVVIFHLVCMLYVSVIILYVLD